MLRRLATVLTLATAASSQDPCRICKDGTPVDLPNKIINILPNEFVPSLPCQEFDDLAGLAFQTGNPNCDTIQSLGTLCGCPQDEGACTLCEDGSGVTNEFKRAPVDLPVFTILFGDIEATLCGCSKPSNNGTNATLSPPVDVPIFEAEKFSTATYGNENVSQLLLQQRITRSSAILSIFAALIVIIDNLRDQKRRKNVYNQIVTLMAMFDIITSIAYSLLDVPRPVDDALVNPFEMGNAATCTAQGWFIQWGQSTSLALNAALSTYYLVSIVYCYTESKINKLRKYVLCVPLLIGIILALAAIPFISYGASGCFVLHPGISDVLAALGIIDHPVGWGPLLGLVIVPIYLVILYTTSTMIRVYWYVRKTGRKSNSWSFRSQAATNGASSGSSAVAHTSNRERCSIFWRSTCHNMSCANKKPKTTSTAISRLRREVAWQSLWYLFALYITWGLYATVNLTQASYFLSHWNFWNVYFFLLPLQGFMNALVYFRPRFSRQCSSFLKDLKKRRGSHQAMEGQEEDVVDTAEKLSATQRSKQRMSLFRLCAQKSNFHDVEPAVDLLLANRESHETADSVVDQQRNSNDDVEDPKDDDEDASVGDGGCLEDATFIRGESEQADHPGGDFVPANELVEECKSDEAKEEEKETSEIEEVAASSQGVGLRKIATRTTKKETLESRRRRSSLKMLVGTLVGVDRTAWSRKSNGSGSVSSSSS